MAQVALVDVVDRVAVELRQLADQDGMPVGDGVVVVDGFKVPLAPAQAPALAAALTRPLASLRPRASPGPAKPHDEACSPQLAPPLPRRKPGRCVRQKRQP